MRASRYFCIWAALCAGSALQAQEKCGAEVKLLLVSTEIQSVVTLLNARKKTTGRVYFFDTSTLDLLSQGVIVRLRQGATADLTVKLRLPTDRKIVGMPGSNDQYKCEVDVIGGVPVRSYSIQTKFAGSRPPTGSEIFALLSPAQKHLLEQAQVSIEWTQVKRIADIHSTDWQIKGQAPFGKLVLELWEWPTGKILELSTKVGADAASSTYRQLEHLEAAKGLSLNSRQRSKTALALENIAQTTAQWRRK